MYYGGGASINTAGEKNRHSVDTASGLGGLVSNSGPPNVRSMPGPGSKLVRVRAYRRLGGPASDTSARLGWPECDISAELCL